jgi:hypothetical protein
MARRASEQLRESLPLRQFSDREGNPGIRFSHARLATVANSQNGRLWNDCIYRNTRRGCGSDTAIVVPARDRASDVIAPSPRSRKSSRSSGQRQGAPIAAIIATIITGQTVEVHLWQASLSLFTKSSRLSAGIGFESSDRRCQQDRLLRRRPSSCSSFESQLKGVVGARSRWEQSS